MKIPVIKGVIERRMLINFAVDEEVAKTIVPFPFRPKIIKGKAVAGICLIRLAQIRPKGLPAFLGLSSENGAHRIAVEWDEDDGVKEGVYIPRRDSSSLFNTAVGGRLFPGKHYRASFDVREKDGDYHVAFKSSDGALVSVDAHVTSEFSPQSVFGDLNTASAFFKAGSLGFSPNGNKYDGLLLNAYKWEVKSLKVNQIKSTFFENEAIFPKGSVHFDNALLMTNIHHEWSSVEDKSCI
jgi:hypothetical protein